MKQDLVLSVHNALMEVYKVVYCANIKVHGSRQKLIQFYIGLYLDQILKATHLHNLLTINHDKFQSYKI